MIHYGRQSIDANDINAVVEALQSDFLTTGPAVAKFEADISAVAGGTPSVVVSSGTAALHAAYVAAGLGPGDEVITPPITFVATQAAAMHVGAAPVVVDVQSDTGNLDPEAVAAAVTPRTRAIVAVDFAGHPADMDELRSVADRHDLLLIEDAAHSLGSIYRGRAVGSIADITTFSFYPTKNITTGEGGAVLSQNPNFLLRAQRFARQGLVREPSEFIISDVGPWHQEVHEIGLNYRLPDFAAALGSSQLKRLQRFKQRRASIKSLYDAMLADVEQVTTPVQRAYVDPMWHLYPVRVPATMRRRVVEHLRSVGVGVQVNYMPSQLHPALHEVARLSAPCPVADAFYAQEISLPMHVELKESELEFVVRELRSALDDCP